MNKAVDDVVAPIAVLFRPVERKDATWLPLTATPTEVVVAEKRPLVEFAGLGAPADEPRVSVPIEVRYGPRTVHVPLVVEFVRGCSWTVLPAAREVTTAVDPSLAKISKGLLPTLLT